ncbi:hypothetical protein GCM10011507_28490 [Edaphobacter acidisoli]|uniref:Uncharacterized protein n=1 Tax=Edaphobacter acidisoli TaxID=2040573 RepID=A0A916RX85_9BACT|nr:hypothetical protein [Edaphobacter acidisoli]GGA75431.1 hypothetical protein GCM10011507_28490 [Edaphobacter acidisoli]
MHGEPVNNPNEAINLEEALLQALDTKIVQALEMQPEVAIPANFAARVASQVPVRRSAIRRAVLLRPTHYGLKAMVASLVALAVILVALLANHFGHTAIGQVMEWIIYSQFLLLAVWFGVYRVNIFSALRPHRAGK